MIRLADIDTMLAEKHAARDRLARELEALDADIALTEGFKAMLARGDNGELFPGASPASPSRRSGAGSEWPGLRAAIRGTFDRHHAGFTLDNVMDDLARLYPGRELKRVLVSGELWRMAKNNEIHISEKGSGNKPHVYKKGGKSEK